MLDLTEGNMTIWSRFKKLYKLLHPPSPPKEIQSRKSSARSPRGLPGEGGGEQQSTQFLMEPRNSRKGNSGEDNQIDQEENIDDLIDLDEQRQSVDVGVGGSGPDFQTTDFDTEHEGQEKDFREIDEKSLEIVSRSHFMLSLLPRDDLTEVLSMTDSEKAWIQRDLQRNQTQAFSEGDSEENFLEKTMLGHEKYILDSVNKEFAESDDENDQDETWSSGIDLDAVQRKKDAAAKSKTIYGEMSVCLEEVDAFHFRDSRRDSSELDDGTSKGNKIKNPPGTPETAVNSDDEGVSGHKWAVPVPSAIIKGEIEMTPEEYELKTELESQIRRLSQPADEFIKTPSEMGSATTLAPPESAQSGESGYNNPLYQKLLTTKIESPKRKFFAQVRIFNEFWNMALPVCNQQGVKYWEVGLCDEDSALEKAIFIWNELESRFDSKAQVILETELKEEDEEILESFVKWGQPFESGDIRYRQMKDKGDDDEEEDEDDDSPDDSEVDTVDQDSESDSGSVDKEKDELSALENKPDLYWKAQKRREAERCFGDFKYFCPVTLADFKMLRKGSPKYACKYKDRLYYCADENSQLRFLTNPKQFISKAGPPRAPPPRICITGSPGCLQEEIAQELSTEYKVCYVNFRQRLHEILHARFEREIGPENTCKIVAKEETDRAIQESKPGDDLLYHVPGDGEDPGEDGDPGHVKFSFHQVPVSTGVKESVLGLVNIPSQEILGRNEQQEIQSSSLKSLGLLGKHNIDTVPLNSFERTERLTDRKWEKLTRLETYIKAFLENGTQLPEDVLDQFILPLWKEQPFTRYGFILVGFPNTNEDVQYMLRKNLFPEQVFVMECKSVVIRNRLIVPTVDRWHRQQNPSGKKKKRLSLRTQRAKLAQLGIGGAGKREIFPYQVEGRPEVDEFEQETWTYKDAVSRDIARALRYYHYIYSAGIEKMKKTLNKERIDWTPVDTNIGLYQGKHKVLNVARPILKYRNNVFEDTVRLSMPAAQALLDRGVFTQSQLQRWCPIEIFKGNTGVNLWNAPGVKKIPYLHRRFIYFLGKKRFLFV